MQIVTILAPKVLEQISYEQTLLKSKSEDLGHRTEETFSTAAQDHHDTKRCFFAAISNMKSLSFQGLLVAQ